MSFMYGVMLQCQRQWQSRHSDPLYIHTKWTPLACVQFFVNCRYWRIRRSDRCCGFVEVVWEQTSLHCFVLHWDFFHSPRIWCVVQVYRHHPFKALLRMECDPRVNWQLITFTSRLIWSCWSPNSLLRQPTQQRVNISFFPFLPEYTATVVHSGD